MPGAPFLYYGEELGLPNGTANNDEAKRTPMPWDDTAGGGFTTGTPWYSFSQGPRAGISVAAQASAPGSLLSRYRALIRARHASEAMSLGGLKLLSPTQGSQAMLSFVRTLGEERVLVVHNVTDFTASAGPFDLPGSTAEVLFADSNVSTLSKTAGGWQASLPPRATGIWRLKP
jgi:glycosidase